MGEKRSDSEEFSEPDGDSIKNEIASLLSILEQRFPGDHSDEEKSDGDNPTE